MRESAPGPRAGERQPEPASSRIRPTSPLAREGAKTLPGPSAAKDIVRPGAAGAGKAPGQPAAKPSGAGGPPPRVLVHREGGRMTTSNMQNRERNVAEPSRVVPRKPSVPPAESNTTGEYRTKLYPPVGPPRARLPTDQMARLSVGGRPEDTSTPAPSSYRRLGSLERDMDVDEAQESGSKRKRGADRRKPDSDGEDEIEDEEYEEERVAKRSRPVGSGRKPIVGTGTYFVPACEVCDERGLKCEKQAQAWACVRCAKKKVACIRDSTEKRRNARVARDEDNEGEETTAPSDGEHVAPRPAPPARQRTTRSRRNGPDRKGKGKGKSSLLYVMSFAKATTATEPDAEPPTHDCAAEHLADRARIEDLEAVVLSLEQGIERLGGRQSEALQYMEDNLEEVVNRMWTMEETHAHHMAMLGDMEERLERLEGRWQEQGSSGPTLSTAPSAPPAPTWPSPVPGPEPSSSTAALTGRAPPSPVTQQAPPTLVVIPATPQSSQDQPPAAQEPAPSPPLPLRVSSSPSPSTAPISSAVANNEGEDLDARPAPDRTHPAPGHAHPAPGSGNAEVVGGDAVMAAPTREFREPPTPPWVAPPAPSTAHLAPPPPEDPKPKNTRRSRSRSPAPPPSRRSPRLQSPAPSPAPPPAVEDGEVSMEVDQ
jgi:hypothetical protein